jgi:hypothetical protein
MLRHTYLNTRDLEGIVKEEENKNRKELRKVKLDIRHQTYFMLTKGIKLDFNFLFNRRLNMGNIKPLLIEKNIIGYGRVCFLGIKGSQSEKKSISVLRFRIF